MGSEQVKGAGAPARKPKAMAKRAFDLEGRWGGELSAQERRDLQSWVKGLGALARCELRLGKSRSRLAVLFDREQLERASREQLAMVERLLREQSEGSASGAEELARLRQAPLGSAQGILVRDYGDVLAADWTERVGASLQALLPTRCGLKIALGAASPAPAEA